MNRREFIFGSVALGLTGPLSYFSYEQNEFIKCKNDIVYFAKKYLDIDISSNYSKKFLTSCASNEDVVLDAYRMSGKTTLCQVYAIWKAVFEPNQKISFVSFNRMVSSLNNNILDDMISRLPDWMLCGTYDLQRRSYKHFTFNNGSKIYTISESEAKIGFNVGNVMILDEFAFFSNQQDFIERTLPSLSYNNGQLVVASTPYTYFDDKYCDVFQRFVHNTKHMTVIKVKKES